MWLCDILHKTIRRQDFKREANCICQATVRIGDVSKEEGRVMSMAMQKYQMLAEQEWYVRGEMGRLTLQAMLEAEATSRSLSKFLSWAW